MAFKQPGVPMIDTSKKHGTNKNFKKSGPPGFFGNLMKGKGPLGLINPIGAIASRMGAFGGNKNPQNPVQPVAPPTQPTEPAKPVVPAGPPPPQPTPTTPPVDEQTQQ